ncbi:hypothetical protein DPMN_187766 [Dreissena polymorpha]|uniref:Uncharacterized protein n=1 Tax=Dreissena polymorpha TaxID=45954 RepID=A0A9D4DR82_DREPO|nr:hypothetical protein DPMN_187766 [Dreissena polymorpha]
MTCFNTCQNLLVGPFNTKLADENTRSDGTEIAFRFDATIREQELRNPVFRLNNAKVHLELYMTELLWPSSDGNHCPQLHLVEDSRGQSSLQVHMPITWMLKTTFQRQTKAQSRAFSVLYI